MSASPNIDVMLSSAEEEEEDGGGEVRSKCDETSRRFSDDDTRHSSGEGDKHSFYQSHVIKKNGIGLGQKTSVQSHVTVPSTTTTPKTATNSYTSFSISNILSRSSESKSTQSPPPPSTRKQQSSDAEDEDGTDERDVGSGGGCRPQGLGSVHPLDVHHLAAVGSLHHSCAADPTMLSR